MAAFRQSVGAGFLWWPAWRFSVGAGGFRLGSDYEQAYWSQTCRRSRSMGAEPGRVLSVPAGGCRVGRCRVFRGPVRFAALADMWVRPMICFFFFYYYYISSYL